MNSQHVVNVLGLALVEGLTVAQVVRILSKSFQIITLRSEHLWLDYYMEHSIKDLDSKYETLKTWKGPGNEANYVE